MPLAEQIESMGISPLQLGMKLFMEQMGAGPAGTALMTDPRGELHAFEKLLGGGAVPYEQAPSLDDLIAMAEEFLAAQQQQQQPQGQGSFLDILSNYANQRNALIQ
jgi:hypothetical protein